MTPRRSGESGILSPEEAEELWNVQASYSKKKRMHGRSVEEENAHERIVEEENAHERSVEEEKDNVFPEQTERSYGIVEDHPDPQGK